jgi:hypothetical protein
MEVSGQRHASTVLSPGKGPMVRTGWEAGWAPEPVWMLWRREISFSPAENRTQAAQPVARRYIDRAIPGPIRQSLSHNLCVDLRIFRLE